MSWFDHETAVERAGGAESRWTGRVHRAWNIGDNPNGGYLVAIALRALGHLSAHPDPITVTSHYLRPGSADVTVDVDTTIVRSGRTVTTARAALVQQGSERVEVVAAFGDLGTVRDSGPTIMQPPPSIPPPSSCVRRSGDEQGVSLPILDRLDIMLHPDQARAGQFGEPEVTGWIRHADGRSPDTHSLVLFADAFAPSLFGLLGNVGWVPTIELTVHVRSRPADGWVLGQFRTIDLRDGRMIEDGTLWDEAGDVVARSRQLGLLITR